MAKYSNYIELSQYYESVVDIGSDSRNPRMWQEYIVHEDMTKAIEVICDSLKYEHEDKRRSFWIHGAYGTGKSYAGIVLKHLFEDKEKDIKEFLSKPMLIPYRERFLSIRKKGKFLVIWQSQATDIKSGIQLLMTMEAAIRESLREKFGSNAYYGNNSLIAAAQEAVRDSAVNWDDLFNNRAYALSEEYASVEEFREEVLNGSLKAANAVARIYRDKNWGFFKSLEMFKDWIGDVISGNHLQDTGIIFIWDEFTSYIRNNITDDMLQPLSEFCKEQPFFMFLIVHKAPSWVSQVGEEVYDRIMHRFHELDFHVSESAAYELIGNSIRIRAGMEKQWYDIQKNLMKSIRNNFADFDNLDMSNKKERFQQLCPLHPMTLSLLAIVAQNFGASQRTLFRFMKDPKESEQNVGFLHYINNYGPDDWRWLTPDFLWDYFFTRDSDVRSFSPEAKSAYQHYMTKHEFIASDYHKHVFKAAMLLIAVMGSSSVSNLYSKATHRKVSATVSTLYKCFAGQLTEDDVNKYIEELEQIGVLRLDDMPNGDRRLQIPYSGNADVFEVRKDTVKRKHTRYELLSKNGAFAKSVQSKIWGNDSAWFGRLFIAACDCGKTSVKTRFGEVQAELAKFPYKFGILVITISEPSQFSVVQAFAKKIASQDESGRLAVYLLKEPLTDEQIDSWYDAITHSELAAEEGKRGDSERKSDEANSIVEEWSATAASGNIWIAYRENVFSLNDAYDAANTLEECVLSEVFSAAPEHVVKTSTAYKKNTLKAALAGVQKSAPDKQIGNILEGLKNAKVLELNGLEELSECSSGEGGAIAKLASFILQKFSQGVQIKLDSFWQELQEAPYGFYNNMACGYILGFLLRHYVDREFSWNKGDNNPWPLSEQNLATMISDMCSGKVVNNYLSPGTEVWQKFKHYVEKVFQLQESESVNEIEARKYISKQCTEKAGVPFWTLKYVSEDHFGGVAAKKRADEIIDLFCCFMSDIGDQEKVMSDITLMFKGHGPLRTKLEELFFDRNITYQAFSCFIFLKCPDLKELQKSIGLTNQDIFDAIRQIMQGQISTWTEEQVAEKLVDLCLEYRVVSILNDALKVKRKSIKTLSDDIANAFKNMKIPGTVIEKMDYPWILALQDMHALATNQWTMNDVPERQASVERLATYAAKVWAAVTFSKQILQKYLEDMGEICTEDELNGIYYSLKSVRYDSLAADFDARIESQLNNVAFNRNKVRLQELWKNQSGYDTVTEWCNSYSVPIHWVVDDNVKPHISVIKSIQDGIGVNYLPVHNATQFFENHNVSVLKDKAFIKDRFFAQIGDNYREAFETSGEVLISRLKTDLELSSDVYSWSTKVGEIRKSLNTFLRDKFCADAKKNVMKMKESVLREKIIQLLDNNPDLYALFLN